MREYEPFFSAGTILVHLERAHASLGFEGGGNRVTGERERVVVGTVLDTAGTVDTGVRKDGRGGGHRLRHIGETRSIGGQDEAFGASLAGPTPVCSSYEYLAWEFISLICRFPQPQPL